MPRDAIDATLLPAWKEGLFLGSRVRGVATVVDASPGTWGALASIARLLEAVEIRSDLTGAFQLERLRSAFQGKLLWTYRSRVEGGAGAEAPMQRRARILEAAQQCDWLDLEAKRDLDQEILTAVSPERRILSWHGTVADVEELFEVWRAMAQVPARAYKLVVEARRPGESLLPLELLLQLEPKERARTVAFAMGVEGAWTRLLAPRVGAPFLYGYVGSQAAALGQFSWEQLTRDYGLPELFPAESLFGVVGCPVLHSLSPRLHNAAYRALGIPALLVPFETSSFSDFWIDVVESGVFDRLGLPIRGLAVTTPFKELAVAVAGAVSPLADQLEAANSLVLAEDVWEADSTDPEGVLGALMARGVTVAGRKALILGVGGAGRAAAMGLARAGAQVSVTNRDATRGRQIARRLKVAYRSREAEDWNQYSLIVNATPLGRQAEDPNPVPVELLAPGTVLVDLVYREEPTRWVRELRQQGFLALDGREVLLYQAVPQFRRMTGCELPVALGWKVLGLEESGT